MGLSAPFFNSVFMALIQTKVEPKYLGRVLGLTGAIMTLASPLGLGLTALFADATDVPLWFLLAGVITLTCGGLMLLGSRRCVPVVVRDCADTENVV